MTETPLPDRMRADLTSAMKERDRARVTVLRTALAALANAEAVAVDDEAPAWPAQPAGTTEVARLELTADDHQRILGDLIADRRDTAATYDANDRAADADVIRAEIALLTTYVAT